MTKTRPCWDEVWMRVASTISERSVDPKHKVGAIIVTEDNTQLLSLGYNGNYRGGPNTVESSEPGETGLIHAEINALLKMDYNIPIYIFFSLDHYSQIGLIHSKFLSDLLISD